MVGKRAVPRNETAASFEVTQTRGRFSTVKTSEQARTGRIAGSGPLHHDRRRTTQRHLCWPGRSSARKERMRHGSTGAATALLLVGVLVLAGCDSGDAEQYATSRCGSGRGGGAGQRAGGGAGGGAGGAEGAGGGARVERLVVKDGQEVGSRSWSPRLSADQVDDQVRQAQAAVDAASSLGGWRRGCPPGRRCPPFSRSSRRWRR